MAEWKSTNTHWTRNHFTLKISAFSILNKLIRIDKKNKPFSMHSWFHSHCVMLAAWPSPRTPRQALLLERKAECNKNCKKAEEILFFFAQLQQLDQREGTGHTIPKEWNRGQSNMHMLAGFFCRYHVSATMAEYLFYFSYKYVKRSGRHVVLPLSLPTKYLLSGNNYFARVEESLRENVE